MSPPEQLRRSQPFWWFQGASVKQLYDQLAEYGPDTARLEVHVTGTTMHFRVIAADGETLPITNDSHVCPPQCP